MQSEPQKEHQWLSNLVGAWTFESECKMGPDQPPMVSQGAEFVRSLGGLWTVAEANAEVPGASGWQSIMTLGFDPRTGRFIGTFIATMMSHMWVYNGTLDVYRKTLTLDTEGPSFTAENKMVKYQDIIEIKSGDHRILRAQSMGEDGKWQHFMTAHYWRVK